MVSMTLIALAIGTLLQAIPVGPVGSGFLCQPIPSVVYFVPSLVAAKHGGLAVLGMSIIAGVVEVGLARLLPRLRALFPTEIAGLVVMLHQADPVDRIRRPHSPPDAVVLAVVR